MDEWEWMGVISGWVDRLREGERKVSMENRKDKVVDGLDGWIGEEQMDG